METLLYWIKRAIPRPLLAIIRPPYHHALAYFGAQLYKHPTKDLFVIAVTGTKGKSTVTELITAILEADGKQVASLSTIQFRIGEKVRRNLFKMTTPGRFFVQRFLREAVDSGCTHAVIELTSEGAKQFRHRYLNLNAVVFTNLTPEHIESHGSFESYKNAKLSIVRELAESTKQPRYLVVNVDDEHGADFLAFKVEEKHPYSLSDLKLHTLHKDGVGLVMRDGEEEVTIRVPLVGLFNVYNVLAAVTLTRAMGIDIKTIERALRSLPPIKGRVEHFESPREASKHITAVVDYAHTPDSLRQFYEAFPNVYKIGILGNTGGGRDTWKRPEMGTIAAHYCDRIILTNEDPYGEDPRVIVEAMAKGIEDKAKLDIIMDRRLAIHTAIEECPDGGYVLISGKGTDPYIMGPHGSREKWSDAEVVKEELAALTASE